MNKDNIVATVSCTRDEFNDLYFEIHHIFSQLPIGFKHLKTGSKIVEHLAIFSTLKNCLSVATVMIQKASFKLHAATLNDTFWVHPAKSHLSWNNVSLFQNPFDDVVARIAFEVVYMNIFNSFP